MRSKGIAVAYMVSGRENEVGWKGVIRVIRVIRDCILL
jgi:hypothetical protein